MLFGIRLPPFLRRANLTNSSVSSFVARSRALRPSRLLSLLVDLTELPVRLIALPDLIVELELTDAGCGYPIDFANELADELFFSDEFEDKLTEEAGRDEVLAERVNPELDLFMLLPELMEELELTDAGCGYPIDFANELVDELLAIDVFEDAAREDVLADAPNTVLD